MFVKLVEILQINENEFGFLADNRTIGFGLNSNHVDFDLNKSSIFPENSAHFISSIPDDVIVRFISRTRFINESEESFSARTEDIRKVGYVEYTLDTFIEKKLKTSVFKVKENALNELKSLRASFDPNFLNQLGISSSFIENYQNYFNQPSLLKLASCGAQADARFFAILKLVKLGTYPISLKDFAFIRENLPLPHSVSLSLRRLKDSETQLFLRKKSKQEESGRDQVSYQKYEDVQNSIAQADLSGNKFVQFEMNILFEGEDESKLLQDIFEAKNRLKLIGQFEPEIYGIMPSLLSARVAGAQHHTLIERDDKIQVFLPIYNRGSSQIGDFGIRDFVFHRDNNTLCRLDPYDTHNNNYSGVIIGQSGRGKSVFNNLLLKCLLNDPNCKVILVDVMGSYRKLVSRLGGTTHPINSSDPSGISPFEFLRSRRDKAVIEIVLDYIEKLLLEDDEVSLRKSEQVELEKVFISYMESNPKDPSIDSFLQFSKEIPRRINLERWRSKGLFGNVFFPLEKKKETRLQYFDFTEISGASNGGLAKAVMSAIMAHFNFLLLSKSNDEKLIFICDETPFFIKNCFSSFTLLSKNVRKLSGSLILTAQMLSDLVVNGDASLVSQSEFKILFSNDGSDEFFRTFTGISEENLETLKTIRPNRGDYSIFIFKDGLGERICKLILSKNEYFTSSTHSDDKSLISKCKNIFNLEDDNKAVSAVTLLREAGII